MMAAPQPDTVQDNIDELMDTLPRRESMRLVENNTSVQQTIMQHAIEECDAKPGDDVDQWWLPEQQFVVIDLGGGDDGGR